jgi:hypothetical protein
MLARFAELASVSSQGRRAIVAISALVRSAGEPRE